MIAPQADPVTRQVPIYVSIPNVGGRLVAGLFRRRTRREPVGGGLVVPINAVNMTRPHRGSCAWRMEKPSAST
jgi:multidrug efflux pump subunit AcrA (membrane-fusion protein)